MSTTPNLIGIGVYAVPEAAHIIGAHAASVRHWLAGYTVKREGEHVMYPGVICPQIGQLEGQWLVSFLDMIEMMTVQALRREKVSLQTVRKCWQAARVAFRSEHPFATHRIETDGKTIFGYIDPEEIRKEGVSSAAQDLKLGQYVLEHVAKDFYRKIDWEKERAVRYWPMGKGTRVVIDPRRSFGTPIDNETGVPTRLLNNMVQGGEERTTVARWYQVPVEAVDAAVEFEAHLMAA